MLSHVSLEVFFSLGGKGPCAGGFVLDGVRSATLRRFVVLVPKYASLYLCGSLHN